MATQTLTTQNNNLFAPKPVAAPSNPAPQDRIRAYKDFLTPALHRRFTLAAATALGFCLLEAWCLSNNGHLLWSWFPLGPAGLRALLVFIPCLAVFIVRVANMHVGQRTSTSAAESVVLQLAGVKGFSSTLHTFAWYIFGAWFFGEVYIWTRKESAELAMVDQGLPHEKPRLNENPLYLRSLFIWVGLIQAGLHLVRDYDRVLIPLSKDDEKEENNIITSSLGPYLKRIPLLPRVVIERFGKIGTSAVNTTIVVNMINLVLYFALIRRLIWPWTYSSARLFNPSLPENAPPTGIMHFSQILWQIFVAPLGLISLWEISNVVFSAAVAQKPLKKEAPLTSEIKDARGVVLHKSKDPNGSLLTGLKSKKEIIKSFAFWELAIICEQFDQRRKTIYTEVDRKDGSTWTQVCDFTVKEIEAIKKRIDLATQPVDYKAKQQEIEAQKQYHKDLIAYQPGEQSGLRRIADQTVKDDADVFAKENAGLVKNLGNMTKSVGQTPGGQNPAFSLAQKILRWGVNRLVSPEGQKRMSPEELQAQATSYRSQLLRTSFGDSLRKTFARRVISVIFGTPTSSRANIFHAAKSLTKLCVSSLKEDDYGQVQKDIARIVRTFTTTIQTISHFTSTLAPNSTDVTFTEQDRTVREVEELLAVLKGGLEEIMLAFGEYTSTLGLSMKDVREAREAAATLKALPPVPPKPEIREFPRAPDLAPPAGRQRRVYN